MCLLLFISMNETLAQNTLVYDSLKGSPKASLNDISWMQGHWKGEAFGGYTEEVWSPPSGNSMMFAFKSYSKSDEVKFYEFGVIMEIEGTLILRFKHFTPDIKGWETKDDYMNYKLVKVTPDKVYFDGFTFEKISENEIIIYVMLGDENGSTETQFNYQRAIL